MERGNFVDCAVCWNPLHAVELIFTHVCGRPLHRRCIDMWLNGKAIEGRSCPICRSIVSNHVGGEYKASLPFGGQSIVKAAGARAARAIPGRDDHDGREIPSLREDRWTLSILHPRVALTEISDMQRIELMELRLGRMLKNDTSERGFPGFEDILLQIPLPLRTIPQTISNADSTVQHIEVDLMICSGAVVNQERSAIAFWRKITPNLVARLVAAGLVEEAQAAREALDLAGACYFVAAWFVMEIPLSANKICSTVRVLPGTWNPSQADGHSALSRAERVILGRFFDVIKGIGPHGRVFANETGVRIRQHEIAARSLCEL